MSRTGTGARAASDSRATASPWALRTAGCSPRARSRSSAREVAISPGLGQLGPGGRVAVETRLQHGQVEGECDEPLLSPVVQIALQSLALLLARLDDPGPGTAQLVDMGP